MKIENGFHVKLPVEETWKLFQDVERIAPCMPGATYLGAEGEDHRGKVKVKLGPITSEYKGAARFAELDEAAHRLVLQAKARETKGQGNAQADVAVSLTAADDGGTDVRVETELKLAGKAAQFGRGILEDVSTKLIGQFVDAIEAEFASAPVPAPAAVASGESGAGGEAPAEAPAAAAPRPPRERVEAIDLLEVGGASVAKRVVPAVIVAVLLGLLIWWLSR